MKLLAIDPGYERVGIAILEKEKGGTEFLVYSDCFKTSAKIPFHERITLIGIEVERVIKKYKPTALAIEKLYLTTNQKTAMQVAEARGVIIYSSSKLGLFMKFPLDPLLHHFTLGPTKNDVSRARVIRKNECY